MISILGISGSPIANSNTDRAIKGVLEASGLKYEFIKLGAEINVKPCRACKQCVPHNICQVKDDFPAIAVKIKKAKALVIGAYTPYGMIDANTKSFLERLWSMRHVNYLNKGKLGVVIVSGLYPYSNSKNHRKLVLRILKPILRRNLSVSHVASAIVRVMRMERMEHIGTVEIKGNVPCLTCGQGNFCEMSGVPILYGKDAKATKDLCVKVEDQEKVWNEIIRMGEILGARLS